MSNTERSYDAFVAFHSLRPHTEAEPIRPNIAGLPETIAHLHEQGVGAVFVPKQNYEAGEQIMARGYMPEPGADLREPLVLPRAPHEMLVSSTGLIRAVRARIATPGYLQDVVPIVNDLKTRRLGGSKYEQARLFGDYMPATHFVDPCQVEIGDLLDQVAGKDVVLKADNGSGGRNKRIGVPKADAQYALAELRAEMGDKAASTGVVLQEMASGRPIRGLRALSADEQPLIDNAQPEGTYELGVYSFANTTSDGMVVRQNAVYRLHPGDPKMDRWVGVDQDSVDPAFFKAAQAVVGQALRHTGSRGMLMRVDLFSDSSGNVRMREANTRDPDPEVGNALVHATHSRMLGEQLGALALDRQ